MTDVGAPEARLQEAEKQVGIVADEVTDDEALAKLFAARELLDDVADTVGGGREDV